MVENFLSYVRSSKRRAQLSNWERHLSVKREAKDRENTLLSRFWNWVSLIYKSCVADLHWNSLFRDISMTPLPLHYLAIQVINPNLVRNGRAQLFKTIWNKKKKKKKSFIEIINLNARGFQNVLHAIPRARFCSSFVRVVGAGEVASFASLQV